MFCVLFTGQYQRLDSFARLLNVALSVGIGRKVVILIDLLLDFLTVTKDVKNKRYVLGYRSESFVESLRA